MLIKAQRSIYFNRFVQSFSTKYTKGQQSKEDLKKKDLDRSYEQFAKAFNIEKSQPISLKQNKIEETISIKQQIYGQDKKFQPNNITQKMNQQTNILKEKILKDRVKSVEDKQNKQYFAQFGRAEQVYYQNAEKRQNVQVERDITELNELIKGEDEIDQTSTPFSWIREQNSAWEYSMDRLEKAYEAQDVGLQYIPNTTKSAADIAEWRQWNEAFEPIAGQLNDAYPELQYPGNKNGENPQDDPDHFIEWFQNSYPPEIVQSATNVARLIRNEADIDQSEDKDEDQNEEMNESTYKKQIYVSAYEAIQPCLNLDLMNDDVEDRMADMEEQLTLRSRLDDDEIEPLPEFIPLDPDEMINEIENWSRFRATSIAIKLKRQIQEIDQIQYTDKDKDNNLSNQITSLYPYYATLPKFARENQIVKTAYKALEFTKPTLSIKEKEMALNFMCTASLELDELSDRVFSELGKTRRFHPTLSDEIRLIHENESEVIDAYINPELNEQFQNAKPMYPDMNPPEGEMAYPYPERFLTEEQDTTPVDYYQNDDGFWDQYINNKLERYTQAHRPSTSRKYFKH